MFNTNFRHDVAAHFSLDAGPTMETERRILRSTTILFGAHIVSQLANLVFVLLFARVYSPALFGEYSFALALGSVLAVFVSMGMNTLVLRNASRDVTAWRDMAGLVVPCQLFLATCIVAMTVAVAILFGAGGTELRIIAIITVFQLLHPVWTLFTIGFTATERMGCTAIADVSGRLLILLGAVTAITLNAPPQHVLLAFPISSLLVLVIVARMSFSEFGRPRFRIDLSECLALLREALPFFGVVALAAIYVRIGILLLRATSSPAEVGLFASAERLVSTAGVIYITFGQAIYPAILRLFTTDRIAFAQLVSRCARLILLVSLPTATLLFLFSDDLIGLLFGEQYMGASKIMKIVAFVLALRGITMIFNHIAMASDHQALIIKSNIFGITSIAALCLVLAPRYGAFGLAVAVLLTQVIKSLYMFIMLRPTGHLPRLDHFLFPIGIACLATIVLATLLADQVFIVRATIVLLSGVSLLYVFRALRVEDFQYAYRILSSRSRADQANETDAIQ